jgi:threonine/homoserine/homoserine lactone efflux protein
MTGDAFGAVSGINWETYWLYLLTEAALSLSPGPAVMLVIAYGLTQGARRSVFASLGILSANAIYFALSATALGAVIASSPGFFTIVRWLGAGYLVYIGVLALVGQPSPITVSTGAARGSSPRSIYLSGLALQLANPKTLVFFIAILPQFVNAGAPIGVQMAWLAAGSIVPEFVILAGYGFLASRAARVATSERFARLTDRAAGVLVLLTAALVLGVTS